MSIVPSVLFTLAAIAAILTIWKNVATALPAIRALRTQLADTPAERAIHVATLQTRTTEAEEPRRRPARLRRSPQSKPITHRLHHFPHRAHAA